MEKNNEFSIRIDENQLRDIEDPFNSNVEVFVTFEDGLMVTIIVGTPKNLEYLMAKDQVNFYGPGLPWIIVKELTVETIHEAIQGYMDDCPNGYWLKLYYFWNEINTNIFDSLDPLEMDESVQLNLFIKLDQLKTQLRKHYEIEESEKLNLIINLNKSLKLLENFKSNSEKPGFQLDQQLALADKYLNFTKALLVSTSLLAIIQIFEIFSLF
jgi:hypothetical protein